MKRNSAISGMAPIHHLHYIALNSMCRTRGQHLHSSVSNWIKRVVPAASWCSCAHQRACRRHWRGCSTELTAQGGPFFIVLPHKPRNTSPLCKDTGDQRKWLQHDFSPGILLWKCLSALSEMASLFTGDTKEWTRMRVATLVLQLLFPLTAFNLSFPWLT